MGHIGMCRCEGHGFQAVYFSIGYILYKYHPTSGLMQILHFDWLCYYRSISNSHRVVKFAGFVNLFNSFYSKINIFFLLNLLLLFSVRLAG